jgi:polysaccharide export outer membrane protein
MKTCLWLLVFVWVSTPLYADPTNLVQILRDFQRQLDLREGRLPRPEVGFAFPATDTNTTVRTVQPQGTATNSTAATPINAAPQPDYDPVLLPGDVVKIEIVGEPDMSAEEITILPDGMLELPLVKRHVEVTGKTLLQATAVISNLLSADYLVEPRVSLQRVSPPQCAISVTKGVVTPGTYTYPCDEPFSILQALEKAGGATSSADLSRVLVRRNVEGRRQDFIIDVGAMSWNTQSKPLVLLPGDEIEVPDKTSEP